MHRHGLILGCGRSGTSIFGELFQSLPGVDYFSEPLLSELPEVVAPGVRLVVKVPVAAPDERPPAGWPVDPDALERTLPTPLVTFWQVRHPLDAISSLRVGIGDGWAHHPRPPDWQRWQHRPLVERCAHHWAVINGDGYDAVRSTALVNRFELMISDPRSCAERAVRAVGIDPSTVSAEIAQWADRVQDTNNDKFVEAVTSRRHSRADHERRVGRWQDDLSQDEVASVLPLVRQGAAVFGYELPAELDRGDLRRGGAP